MIIVDAAALEMGTWADNIRAGTTANRIVSIAAIKATGHMVQKGVGRT